MLALTVSRRKTYKNLRQCTNGEGGGDIFVLLSEILSAAFNLLTLKTIGTQVMAMRSYDIKFISFLDISGNKGDKTQIECRDILLRHFDLKI